jgi:hypothetical protein
MEGQLAQLTSYRGTGILPAWLSGYPKNLPKGVSEGKNPPVSRFASVGPLCQRGQRRRSRAGDLSNTAEQEGSGVIRRGSK